MNTTATLRRIADLIDLNEIAVANSLNELADSYHAEASGICQGVALMLDIKPSDIWAMGYRFRMAARGDGVALGRISDWVSPAGLADRFVSEQVTS